MAVLERFEGAGISVAGHIGARIERTLTNWLIPLPEANPGILQMFRDRDRRDRPPSRYLLPWSGEFAGKYLIGGSQFLRLTADARLKTTLQRFAADLIACQDAGGYLGVFERGRRTADSGDGQWDLWNQYHCMLGLYEWYFATRDPAALAACRATADHFCETFLSGRRNVAETGSPAQNRSAVHVFAVLHRQTGEPRYLEMARAFQRDWAWDSPFGSRWEAMHALQARAELHLATGDRAEREELERIWWRLAAEERHNTGGWGAKEEAGRNPYSPLPIETCATVAWVALTVDMLRVTGDSRAADELELSTWNAVLGSQEPGGRWWTYDTPMGGIDTGGLPPMELPPPMFGPPHFHGERRPTTFDLAWQEREGTPQLSCCSANGPRGLGALADWAVMTARAPLAPGVAINFYGPCSFDVTTPSGQPLRIEQQTDYPVSGTIRMTVAPASPETFALHLRVPSWSRTAVVQVNGEASSAQPRPGSYLALEREWRPGDAVDIAFDVSTRLWVGDDAPPEAIRPGTAKDRISIYHGPLLMAHDTRFDGHQPEQLPSIDVSRAPRRVHGGDAAMILLEYAAHDGSTVTLCDFASAGGALQAPADSKARVWRFGAADAVLPLPLRLRADHAVDGYHFDDLKTWRPDGQGVALADVTGGVSVSLPDAHRVDGRTALRGQSVAHTYDNRFQPRAAVTALVPVFGITGLYVLGIDDRVWTNWYPVWDRPGQWSGWVDWIAGDVRFPQGTPITAVSTRNNGTSLFAIGPGDKVWSNYWPAGDPPKWSGWFVLGDNTFPKGSAVTALSTRYGWTSLYVLGIDDKVWTNYFPDRDHPDRWTGWHALAEDRFPKGTPISAISTEPGATSLFAVGPDGRVRSNYWPAGDPPAWSGWFVLGDNTFPLCSTVTAISTRSSGTSLYVLGTDGKVWTNYFPDREKPGEWTGWYALAPEKTFPTGTTITAVTTRPGGTSLFAIGPDDKVWSTYWPAGDPPGWSGWFALGDNTFPKGSTVTAISPAPGVTQLFVLGIEDRVWTSFFPDGSFARWSAWHALGHIPYELRELDVDWIEGSRTISWLPAPAGSKPASFSRDNPLRVVWP
jgi:uncharacterized protein